MSQATNIKSLTDLLNASDNARIIRANKRPMTDSQWTGAAWVGSCRGARGVTHRCHIILTDTRRAFNCTCQDRRRNAHKVGPCKHVISLAQQALAFESL